MSLESKKNSSNTSGIMLLAKQSGKTSFSSLSAVKRSLKTTKVGHTGTLDSFADGLLVVLVGSLTRLVPHITNFDKTYLAIIEFGAETDTLECTGNITKTGNIPSRQQVEKALEKFSGTIDQVPPAFSAIHIDGKRASDLSRCGKAVEIPARKVTIHSIELLDFYQKYALIQVSCSKGTYIRSLARDIALECGTVAHLKALRRTKVGPFDLKNAAGFNLLPEFSISAILNSSENQDLQDKEKILSEQIPGCLYPMSMEIAECCGFIPVILDRAYVHDFNSGRKLKNHSFFYKSKAPETAQLAVFYPELTFAGIVNKNKRNFSYGFVSGCEQKMKIYSWEQIASDRFDSEFKKSGTSLSIGSFDGTHIGHDSLFDSCLSHNLPAGIVTFRHSTRKSKAGQEYPGDVSTLSQRLEFFIQKGFAFAVVIDFSDEFGKISGTDFLNILKNNCGMKYIAEGEDFRCGYKGSTDISQISQWCSENSVELKIISHVDYLDKRVSSSRIRQDVKEKEFEAVKTMLHRPYEIDTAGFEWERAEGDQPCLKAKIRGIQVYPPDGEYPVDVVISGSEEVSITVRSICKLVSGELRLLDSDGSLKGIVKAIQFFPIQ